MNTQDAPLVSVVIPTKNAGEYIDELLDMLLNQKTEFTYEIIVVDSGSKDQTQECVKSKGVELRVIDPKTFNHGNTRNEAIEHARGQYIAFLTQDALPENEKWLQSMVDPFFRIKNCAGVFGKHHPRPDCNPMVARDIIGHFVSLYNNEETVNSLFGAESQMEIEQKRFFSNVNSCLNREVWEKHPFPTTNYCEDQMWAETVLKNGYSTVYSPKAAVFHSHSFPFLEMFRRYYDEYLGLWDAFQVSPGKNILRSLASAAKTTLKDVHHVAFKSSLPLHKKVYYIAYAPFFNSARQIAAHLAYRKRMKSNRWDSSLSRDKHIKES